MPIDLALTTTSASRRPLDEARASQTIAFPSWSLGTRGFGGHRPPLQKRNMTRCTYLLPIRRASFSASETAEFAEYFRTLRDAGCDLLVMDGSPAQVFQQHHEAWHSLSRHEKVDRSFGYLNDKVNGIHTGVNLARSEKIILGDDDIRYAPPQIDRDRKS